MVVFQVVAAIAALVLLVPLFVWASTGRWRHAVHALREYLETMAFIVVPVLLLVGFQLLTE